MSFKLGLQAGSAFTAFRETRRQRKDSERAHAEATNQKNMAEREEKHQRGLLGVERGAARGGAFGYSARLDGDGTSATAG